MTAMTFVHCATIELVVQFCNTAVFVLQVATWVDETLSSVASKLEHGAQQFTEFQGDKIMSLNTCWLFTCARLESGVLYWWQVAVVFIIAMCFVYSSV